MKLHVVAPSAMVRSAVRATLRPLGWEGEHEAADLAGTLALEDGASEIVLVAWAPPHLDAPEFTRALRENPEWSGSRVIVLGARRRAADVRRAIEAGASDYVLVPYEPTELRARVKHWMQAGADAGDAGSTAADEASDAEADATPEAEAA